MIKKKLLKTLNDQVNAELYSAYLYLSMSSYYSDLNLNGFAHWMRVQAQEEISHGMRLYDYVLERGERMILTAIAPPPTKWKSPQAPIEDSYKHEKKVTGMINNLVDIAIADKDHATNNMLQWFVAEQVEEEANVSGILQQMKLIGKSADGLLVLDRDLATRPIPTILPTAVTAKG